LLSASAHDLTSRAVDKKSMLIIINQGKKIKPY
jgi:hypothetical protein